MSPIGVGISHSTYTLRTGEAKLWILLVGVNQYQDRGLPSLRYPAVDCKGLGDAMNQAIQRFPNKEVIVHNDFTTQAPTLNVVRTSLQRIVSQAQSHDSVILYFSGHGVVESNTQQPILCMADTDTSNLMATGLGMQELLQMLGNSSAHQQLLCLDTCHSGNMVLLGGNRGWARDAQPSQTSLNSTPKFMELLRQRAAKSKGFCALLSCDRGQQSWEFPELGHGVFTYYLMQGLLGAAADSQGIIEADGLYKYVYRNTLQYINKLNHQLRLINEHKLRRGDSELYTEYPLQTPKRIVEGVGELVLGFKSGSARSQRQRQALTVDGLGNSKIPRDFARLLGGCGGFEVEYFSERGRDPSQLRANIQEFIRCQAETKTQPNSGFSIIKDTVTKLLYLRGKIEENENGEAWLVLNSGVRLSRSWLRQELRRSGTCKQIIILDCPEANTLEDWVEDLQLNSEQGQCLIAASSGAEKPELFSQILLETLAKCNPLMGLSVAEWIPQLQRLCVAQGINIHTWISGTRGVIDILPGNISTVFQDLQQPTGQQTQPSTLSPTVPSYSGDTQPSTRSYATAPKHPNKIQNSSPIPTNSFTLNSKYYTQLEDLLKQFIGLIAINVLANVLPRSKNFKELVENLASFTSPLQKEEFKQLAIAIVEAPATKDKSKGLPSYFPSPSPSPSLSSPALDADFIKKCERELAYLVGPFASFMVQNTLKENPRVSPLEFVKKLAEIIPQPIHAVEFKIKMLGKRWTAMDEESR